MDVYGTINRPLNKKFWEELIAYFFLTRHGQHRKRKFRGGTPQTVHCLATIEGDTQTHRQQVDHIVFLKS
jgi:hypothetical protein